MQSNGLIQLARAVAKYADVVIVGPEQPMSATALALTFHKPLRVNKVRRDEFLCYAISGSPGDCVMIGVNKILPRKPDLVVSGINIGDNDTFQDILASGTVAAAIEAVISGIPAIAFSLVVDQESVFALEYDHPDFSNAAVFAGEVARDVLLNGMPAGAELLNVNFPADVKLSTEVVITSVGRRKYADKVMVRNDPRGRPYYWLYGEVLPRFEKGTDAEAVLTRGKVSVSPVVLGLTGRPTAALEQLRDRVTSRVRAKARRPGITDK